MRYQANRTGFWCDQSRRRGATLWLEKIILFLNAGQRPCFYLRKPSMSRLNPCRLCRGLPRLDRFQPPASEWVYLVECSTQDCDNAEFGDSPEEAARL